MTGRVERSDRAVLDTSVVIGESVAPIPGVLAISAVTLAELHFGVLVAKSSQARAELVTWTEEVLEPHAEEEEHGTYAAAARLPGGALLIDAMLREHELIRSMADSVRTIDPPLAAAAWGRALSATFNSHQAKENDIILPLLVSSDAVDLTALLEHHG